MALDLTTYASWFRNSTPYIQAHRGSTFVVLLNQAALANPNLVNLVHDLALLHVLGAKLVLVPEGQTAVARLESLFSAGLPNTPLHGTHIPLTRLPVDSENLTEVVGALGEAVKTGHLVLAVPEATHTACAQLAAQLANGLNAEKLLLYSVAGTLRDADGTPSSMLTPEDLATYIGTAVELGEDERQILQAAMDCVNRGVPRAHIVSFIEDGALLGELFTADGYGTQISSEQETPIRPATLDDLAGIIEIIRPLEAKGALVPRSDEELAEHIHTFLVAELDGFVIGCCLVAPITDDRGVPSGAAELGCVAVATSYRQSHNRQRTSIGTRLLSMAEQRARDLDCSRLFAQTTGPVNWFVEQGFEQVTVADLPPAKQSRYNQQRQSKVLRKRL